MRDFNAKVGRNNTSYEEIMGKHDLGTMNKNGEMFANLCANNNLDIGRTIFPHKPCHLATWISPDRRTENQIDHICIVRRFRRNLQDVRVKRGADAASEFGKEMSMDWPHIKEAENFHHSTCLPLGDQKTPSGGVF